MTTLRFYVLKHAWGNVPCSSVTAFLSVQSDLLPINILFTPSEACCSTFECHVRISIPRIQLEVGRYAPEARAEEQQRLRDEWIRGFVLTIEGLFVGNIVYQQNAHGASVVSRSNSTEALLAGSIPLQI